MDNERGMYHMSKKELKAYHDFMKSYIPPFKKDMRIEKLKRSAKRKGLYEPQEGEEATKDV